MHPTDLDAAITRVALSNHHVITWDDAQEQGITYDALKHRTTSGLLEKVDRGVFRLVGSTATWDQRALIACRSAGPHSVLSHRAGAMVWRLDGFSSAPIELTTDRWSRRRRRDGIIVHESTALGSLDRTVHDSLPVTSVVRTLLDLPAIAHPFRVEEAWEDALRRELCTVEQLVQRFVTIAKRGRRGVKVGRALLERRIGEYVPTGSVLELKTVRLVESSGLPVPERQHAVALADATVFLDLAWVPLKIAIECDGMWDHGTNTQLPWDADRQNQLQLLGWFVLRVSWKALMTNPEKVCAEIVAAYRDRERLLLAGKAHWL